MSITREARPDIVFLSRTVLAREGLQLLRSLRAEFEGAVIALAEEADEEPSEPELLEAIDAGADDYLSMAASPAQFLARVAAALRRTGAGRTRSGVIATCGELTINAETHQAYVGKRELYLTPTEFKLLYHLARNHTKVVTQESLHSLVWGCEEKLYIDTLRKYIYRLRSKLREVGNSDLDIVTIPRVGYRFVQRRAQGLSELPRVRI